MKVPQIGVDMVEIKRFNPLAKRNNKFLLNTYSKNELDYCFSFKNPGPHLAGTFTAKEAVFKTLGKNDILFSSIEIRRDKNSRPTVWIKNIAQKSISVSISHTLKMAVAVAIKI